MLQTPFVLALCLRILLGFQERLFTIGCPYLQLDSRSQNNVDSITGNRQQKRKPLLLSLFLLQSIATLGNVHLYIPSSATLFLRLAIARHGCNMSSGIDMTLSRYSVAWLVRKCVTRGTTAMRVTGRHTSRCTPPKKRKGVSHPSLLSLCPDGSDQSLTLQLRFSGTKLLEFRLRQHVLGW